MHVTQLIRVAALSFFMLASPAWAQDVRISFPGGGALVLDAPEGWRNSIQAEPVPYISFTPASGDSFQVLVSPLVAASGRYTPASRESLRHLVEMRANAAKSRAVEKSIPIQNFGSGPVQGNYFSATDSAPEPGGFKYMTQGLMSVNGLSVAFTILSNGNPQTAEGPALRMLAGARKE